ncbi:hypothetical protein NIES2119_18795 [[Phormidium ambiguum] IAM M-71]|uniref:DUF6816 domain-containing protein n=1 Tax=[Phormidium ambiguum] IAM M-71 TaxID=454136 RepID=A0A1U7IGA7_9CYAN|nr:hypothetical protein [Phormidium ambiguum]OKH36040.1 hypothetical protein NIES2119_18795 [Phormidium ambiguum IAM M-71]
MRGFWFFCLVLVCCFWCAEVRAGTLNDRLSKFPNWDSKPVISAVKGTEDLVYPDWIEGTWNVSSTLVEMVAPLAPDFVSPGFEGNRQFLDKTINFLVRFVGVNEQQPEIIGYPFSQLKTQNLLRTATLTKLKTIRVVADRSFNGLNIAKATLGDRSILSVNVDRNNPNRQITYLPGEKQLIYLITNRATEQPNPEQFIATEISQQIFRGSTQVYLNEVETTTIYQHQQSSKNPISAEQITAIYLSPKDPNYFIANDKPVALYHYHLEFYPQAN